MFGGKEAVFVGNGLLGRGAELTLTGRLGQAEQSVRDAGRAVREACQTNPIDGTPATISRVRTDPVLKKMPSSHYSTVKRFRVPANGVEGDEGQDGSGRT